MGLLGSAGASVQLYPAVAGTDGAGNPMRRPGPTPVTVRAVLQPVSADVQPGTDQVAGATYRLLARHLPAGAWSHLVWAGRTWDLLGEPERRTDSGMTTHVTVLIRARTAEPV